MAEDAALDVSQEATAICLIDESGKVRRQAKDRDLSGDNSRWLAKNAAGLVRIRIETGPPQCASVVENLMQARLTILDRIKVLDRPSPCSRPNERDRTAVHVRTGCRRDHGAVGRLSFRGCRAL